MSAGVNDKMRRRGLELWRCVPFVSTHPTVLDVVHTVGNRGRPTLHLPDFKRSHVVSALHQVFPQLLQLFFQLRVEGSDGRTDKTKTEREWAKSYNHKMRDRTALRGPLAVGRVTQLLFAQRPKLFHEHVTPEGFHKSYIGGQLGSILKFLLVLPPQFEQSSSSSFGQFSSGSTVPW